MKKYWFSSDHHFYHTNIIKYCARPFIDREEMNSALIANWNNMVSNDDIVVYGGDFGFGSVEKLQAIRHNLNGKWTHFYQGNHDKWQLEGCNMADTWISYPKVSTIEIGEYKICMAHNPDKLLANAYPSVIYLHGHTHQSEATSKEYPNMIHIGVDSWNYKPVEFDQILEIYRK